MEEILHGHRISSLARRFAPHSAMAYERFKRSIAINGQQVPIARRDGVIYDGVHRLKACIELGLEPRFTEIDAEEDLLRFVIAHNADRREADGDDRTLTAFLFSEGSTPGRPRSTEENEVNLPDFMTLREATKTFGISESKIKHARRVLRENGTAAPELRQAVLEWSIKFSDASRIVNHPPEVQRQAVERKLEGQVRSVRAGVRQIEAEMRDRADAEAAEAVLSPSQERNAAGGLRPTGVPAPDGGRRERGLGRDLSADGTRMGGTVWRTVPIRHSCSGSRWPDGSDGEPGLSAADLQADGFSGSGMDR